MKTQKTQQELFDTLREGPTLTFNDYPYGEPRSERAIRFQKMGLSKEEAQKQAEKEYQEALENLDFSKKYIIRIGYDGREITGYPFTAIMRSDYDRQRKDVMASPRITIMDIAKGVEAQKDWSDWRCVDEDFMNTPVIKNNAEAHPEDWGKIVKTFLCLRGRALGGTLRKAEDFMLHSPLVTSEKLRQQVKKEIASVKEIDLKHAFYQKCVYDNKDYDFTINPKDLEYLATELCPNTEWLELPNSYSRFGHIETNIADEHIQAISKFKKLKSLIVHKADLTDASFETLGKMKTLEELSFYNGLSDKQLELLSHLPNLKYLEFGEREDDQTRLFASLFAGNDYSYTCFPTEESRRERQTKRIHKFFPHLIPYKNAWIGPGHEKYEEEMAKYDKERRRILGLTTGDWKDKFYEALKKDDKWAAMEILQLNGLVKTKLFAVSQSNWGTDKDFQAKGTFSGMAPWAWFETKDSLSRFDVLDLGNNRVAVGYMYDDSKWERKTGERAWGGGIEYSRSVDVGIIDLDKGLIAESPRSESIKWRDRYDSSKDIAITNMKNFLRKEGNTVVAWLESYGRQLTSTSVAIPQPQTTIRKTLTAGKTDTDVTKAKAARDQKQGD